MIECKCIYKVCVCKPVVNESPKDKRYQWWKDKEKSLSYGSKGLYNIVLINSYR